MRRLTRPKSVTEIDDAKAAMHERIEEPHLDVGMRVERGDRLVHAARVLVVEQQAHPHAALGRLPQRLAQQPAGGIAAQDVVLHVEAALGGAREQHARGERVAAVAERMDAGLARMRGLQRRDGAAEARAAGVGERARGLAGGVVGEPGAGREREQRCQNGRGAQHVSRTSGIAARASAF